MTRPSDATPASGGELKKFLEPYDEEVRTIAMRLREMVLAEAPGATELLYDVYNAVAIAFSFTGRMQDAFCHVAVYTRHVNLGFNRGSELPDPDGVLNGSGKLIRHLKVKPGDDLEAPHLRGFVRLAVSEAPRAGGSSAAGGVIVRKVATRKRRPERDP